jgi:hypothetical protein
VLPVQSASEGKTRGEVALWATRGHGAVRAEPGVARAGEDVDGYRLWGNGGGAQALTRVFSSPSSQR